MTRAKEYAETLYPGQNTWQVIAEKAWQKGFETGYKNGMLSVPNFHKELEELREYKRYHEKMFETGEGLADYIGGL